METLPYYEHTARYIWKPSVFFTRPIDSNSITWQPSGFCPRPLHLSASRQFFQYRSNRIWLKPILGAKELAPIVEFLPKGCHLIATKMTRLLHFHLIVFNQLDARGPANTYEDKEWFEPPLEIKGLRSFHFGHLRSQSTLCRPSLLKPSGWTAACRNCSAKTRQ